jgi:hypothetical protein
MKLVHRNQAIVELFNPELVDGEPKGRMGANQQFVGAPWWWSGLDNRASQAFSQ